MKKMSAFALATVLSSFAGYPLLAATELARVNTTVITLEDFDKRYLENQKFFQLRQPTRKGVLDDLIKRELGIQEAKKLGLDRDPEVVDRMHTVLYNALLDKKLSKEFESIHVTDDEAKSFYTRYPELRSSHIFVAARADAPADVIKRANEKIKLIYDEHVKPAKMTFAEIAQRFSEGTAAPMGGDIDYQTRDKLDPTYYETALKLKSPGRVSGIVRSNFGFHIIKLTAVRPWEEADKALFKRMMFEEKRQQVFDRYMTQLRGLAKVTVRNELLKD